MIKNKIKIKKRYSPAARFFISPPITINNLIILPASQCSLGKGIIELRSHAGLGHLLRVLATCARAGHLESKKKNNTLEQRDKKSNNTKLKKEENKQS